MRRAPSAARRGMSERWQAAGVGPRGKLRNAGVTLVGPLMFDSTPMLRSPSVTEFLSLQDAVARFVSPGDAVALEGFTHLIPFAAGHEIIRQRLTDLTLIRMTPDLIYDQMIGVRLRETPGVLVGRQSRRGIAPSPA